MKFWITILLSCLLLARPLFAVPVGWSTNLPAALEDASRKQQPVLAYFTASWCGPCKLMARTTLTNEAVLQLLSTMNHVAVDLDEQPKLAAQYEVRAVPTFLMLTATGESAATTTGFQSAETFLQWLTNSVNGVNAVVARKKEIEIKLAEVDRLLAGNESNSLQMVATELIELCADRNEPTRKAARERLTALGSRQPLLLLDGLKHSRLAVRIQVSNLLRKQLGDKFEIDPWSDPATRAKGIQVWRDKLAVAKTGG